MAENKSPSLVELSADIAAAYLSFNAMAASEIAGLIQTIYSGITSVATRSIEPLALKPAPAVPIKKSVTPDRIICLEDGKAYKSLRRHLRTAYDLTPEAYRAKWGLPKDYPMVAPNYAAARSAMAKANGLGRKPAPIKSSGRGKKAKAAG